jgi:hypothetical protein
MANNTALTALDRILAAEYNLLEIYQRYRDAPEHSELLATHLSRCQEMTAELAAFIESLGEEPRQNSGLIGTVFRLGETMGSQLWSLPALARQINLAIEEKYRLLSRLPPQGLAIVERHLGEERQMLLELEQIKEPVEV